MPGGPVTAIAFRNECRFGDKCVHLLRAFPSVSMLDLARAPVTDAGLEPLRELTSLTTLNLNQTNVTDRGMKHLAGIETLKAALPRVKIDR